MQSRKCKFSPTIAYIWAICNISNSLILADKDEHRLTTLTLKCSSCPGVVKHIWYSYTSDSYLCMSITSEFTAVSFHSFVTRSEVHCYHTRCADLLYSRFYRTTLVQFSTAFLIHFTATFYYAIVICLLFCFTYFFKIYVHKIKRSKKGWAHSQSGDQTPGIADWL